MASHFDILPAIDLRDGRVVRLRQGDFDQETAFSADPLAIAEGFANAGARWLHVVDLDGARTGRPAHAALIRAIVERVGERLAVEVAGGLRDAGAVATALDAGATRVVVGTAALQDAELVGRLVARHGSDRVAVALDVRAGLAVGHGWAAEAAGVDATDALERLADAGIGTFEVTAIERDGMASGPDVALYERLVGLGRGSVIASAGIRTTADIASVRAVGCSGAIIGRALYDGSLDLAAALRA